jgi:site-specific recombinase XerC
MTLKNLAYYPLTPEGITNYLADLKCGNGKRNYYVSVRAFCNWLYKNGRIPGNPISLVPPPKPKRKLLSSPTSEEVDRIISTAKCLRDKCLVSLAFSSGLRLSELSRIQISDIDFDTMTIRVLVKGNREAKSVFDERTKHLLKEHIGDRASVCLQGAGASLKMSAKLQIRNVLLAIIHN